MPKLSLTVKVDAGGSLSDLAELCEKVRELQALVPDYEQPASDAIIEDIEHIVTRLITGDINEL